MKANNAAAKRITRFPTGDIMMPPSKSIVHRALICAALADGASVIKNVDLSDDIRATVQCLQGLGAEIKISGITAKVLGKSQLLGPDSLTTLNCIESGSTLRFLLPIAALSRREITFTGQGRLMERPQGAYADVFAEKGVKFLQGEGKIVVQGPLPAGEYVLPGNVSSQFVSGLLFALPLVQGNSVITLSSPLESRSYVDMTQAVMAEFGVKTQQNGQQYIIKGGQSYSARKYMAEGDWSAAAFFLCAGALGREAMCHGLDENSLQGDKEILFLLQIMGAGIMSHPDGIFKALLPEKLRVATVDAGNIPDLIPPLATLMCFAQGTSRIVNAARLRYKESDRLSALATQLNALGASVIEEPEGLTIHGKPFIKGGIADACGDHRIAMAAALAAIRCENGVELTGWETVAKSYPAFWQDWEGE